MSDELDSLRKWDETNSIDPGEPDWVREPQDGSGPKSKLLRDLRVTRASDITPTRVKWLWPKWIPASRLVLAGGRPGDGKSSVLTDLAARLTTASPMPDRYRPERPINVGILSAEDAADDTIVPRLLAAGANLERVFIVGGIISRETGLERPWILPDDIPELSDFVRRHEIGFQIIDPLSAFQSAKVDTHRDGAVRAMLLPLSNMATNLGCAVAAIRHHRKGGASDARDAGNGSIAFTAAARLEWTFGTDPSDTGRRVVAIGKSNIGAYPKSLAYRIVQDERWETNRIRWEGSVDVTASDLTDASLSEAERGVVAEAVDFLATVLADGPVATEEVKKQARKADISVAGALRRARVQLHVKSVKLSDGSWTMELPKGTQGAAQDEQATDNAHLARLAHLPSTEGVFREPHSRESEQDEQDEQDEVCGDMRTSWEVDRDGVVDDRDFWDLALDVVGVCRFCHEVAAMTDEAGPVCRACRGSHASHTADLGATGNG